MRFRILAGLSLAAALAAPSISSAQLVATTTTLEQFTNFGDPLSVGYIFNVTSPFTVTHLAFWDQGGNGLVSAHHVSIWSPTGQLLVDGTVDAGTVDPLVSNHRLVQVSPFTLAVGDGYRVAGRTGETEVWAYSGVLANTPGITWTAAAWCIGANLQDVGDTTNPDCGQTNQQTGYFGGNFAGVVATPEPASMTLVATGLLGMFGVARRRRNKTA
ncbi:MAG: PEP-CTERM sorting domain-containing protein [bacterium]